MIGSNATLGASNVFKPTWKDCEVWIDANDYGVGTFANGAAVTNKGNNGATFIVVGSTLEVQLDGNGRKEFEFNGSYIRCSSASSAFIKYHNLASSYAIQVIGKFGTSSNPDAFFSICGNNGGSSTNIGIFNYLDNRTAVAAANRGVTRLITKGVPGTFVFNSLHNNGVYNTDVSYWFNLVFNAEIDHDYLVKGADIVSVYDRVRTAPNTTSGLGAVNTPSAAAPTFAFEIGAAGNGVTALATGSTMKQFIMYGELFNQYERRGADSYFGNYWTRGDTTIRQGGETRKQLTDQYVFGGTYAKSADRSRTIFVSSRGPDHFIAGSDREGVQIVSTDDAVSWPSGYTTVFTDASNAYHVPYGGYSPAGTLIVGCGKYSQTTGAYVDLVIRRSTNNAQTWGSDISIAPPTTSPALTAYTFHDQLVTCNNGDIALMMYAVSTTALYKIYVARSTDDGLTWSFTQVYSSATDFIAEPTICHLGGNNWIIWGRVEVAVGGIFKYKQFFSNDDLATFSDQGNTPFGGALYAHPAMLRSFFIDGTLVVEASWVNRLTRRWHMKYALASAVVSNGISEWTSKTTYTVFERLQGVLVNEGWRSGYPFFIHSRNDLNTQGVWFEENGINTINVAFQYFNDEMKTTIKTELGI
jgi:hypothetical protein